MVRIFCLKYGEKYYNYSHVNRLYQNIKDHLTIPFEFFCITDNSKHISKNIKIIDFDNNDIFIETFNKCRIYNPKIHINCKVLYFDLDVIIHDNIDFLIDDIMYDGITTVCCTWTNAKRNQRLGWTKNAWFQGNSSIIGFYGNDPEVHYIYNHYKKNHRGIVDHYKGGDDIYLLGQLFEINQFKPGHIYSYKMGYINDTFANDKFKFDMEPWKFRHNVPICILNQISTKEKLKYLI